MPLTCGFGKECWRYLDSMAWEHINGAEIEEAGQTECSNWEPRNCISDMW